MSKYPIRVHIATALSLLVILAGGGITLAAYYRTAEMMSASALEISRHAGLEAAAEMERLLDPARVGVDLISASAMAETRGELANRLKALPSYVSALRDAHAVVGFFSADRDGNYFFVRRLFDDADRQLFSAPPQADFLVENIERNEDAEQLEYIYFDSTLHELGRSDGHQSQGFDPRERPWFKLALASQKRILTDPYRFFSSHKQGISIAQPAADGIRVVGADIRLDTLSELLQRSRVTPGTRLTLLNQSGEELARDSGDLSKQDPVAEVLKGEAGLSQVTTSLPGSLATSEIMGRTWRLGRLALPIIEERSTVLAIAVPEDELLAEARQLRNQLLALALALLLLSLPVAHWLARRIALPLTKLADDTTTLRRFDFTQPISTRSSIFEVDELAQTLSMTKATLGQFLDIVSRLSSEKDFQHLLPALLQSTVDVAQVNGGLLMMANNGNLRAVACRWKGEERSLDANATVDADLFACRDALAGSEARSFKASPVDCARFDTPACYAYTVPLFNRDKKTIGVLVLLNDQEIAPLQQCFIRELSGFAAMALETRELIEMQKALFASFIQVMAEAIDSKSPYTGGHCARVPEIARLLAQAACDTVSGPYATFELDEDGWETLHIASWLHDCGKVTTPEYVVDKSTKLETIYDRIHEIRMRFEVLKRDAEINCLKAIAAGANQVEAEQARDDLLATLDDEFAFIAQCNIGGEFMSPDLVERLRKIAARTWQRTLDDRLGVSVEEARRRENLPVVALPVDEPLLADKPEHRIPRNGSERFGPGNPWGFNMRVPELMADRGEMKNLLIARGTLNDEERYKINEHIVQTIVMLNALPFPHHLKNVPEIAGGHHERIDGKGYPRGLHGEMMSPLAKIMAIADVFEALTASDRPYKPAKTLCQSLGIMKKMAEEGHIDTELFRIFVTSGVALQYAKDFLPPEQVDADKLTDIFTAA